MWTSVGVVVLQGLVGSSVAGDEGQARPRQGWAQSETRGGTRLIYFHKTAPAPWDSSPGQVAIEYGQPPWKAAYAAQFDALTRGKRWRLGMNQWTNLSTDFALRIGGVAFDPGYYYLGTERGKDGAWSLIFLDPEEMRDLEFDAWHLDRREAPILGAASLAHELAAEAADQLQIDFTLDAADDTRATLVIRFGPHRLSTVVEVLEVDGAGS